MQHVSISKVKVLYETKGRKKKEKRKRKRKRKIRHSTV